MRYVRPWTASGNAAPFNPYLNDVVMQMLPWTKATRSGLEGWGAAAARPVERLRDAAGRQQPVGCLFTSHASALLLPLPRAFLLVGSIKLLLAAAGMWLWLRELEISKQAALFGAVSFTLSLCFAHWFFFPQTAFCLWPWMLFLLERLRDATGRVRAIVALTAVLVFAALAGHPESAALGGLFAALWILGRWAVGDFPDAVLVLRRAAVSALLAAGLTAFLLIPSILAIGASNRLRLVEKPVLGSDSLGRASRPALARGSRPPSSLTRSATPSRRRRWPGGPGPFPRWRSATSASSDGPRPFSSCGAARRGGGSSGSSRLS